MSLYVAPSPLHGFGVFTDEAFASGDPIEECPVLVIPSPQRELIDRTVFSGYYYEWGQGEGSYTVDMAVTASDRRGLLRDIGDALAREKINVTAARTQNRDDLAFMRFTFEVTNLAHLKRAFAVVRQLKGVIRVARG